ncbi:MAG: Phosphoribosylglycinamide formyltransferase [Bacteroidetes bacterium ADurb.Bin141]|nr:phosphoribosylglycinamide formyltransferase [Bacteroidia bacterium]MCO5289659.1 phosphoribosylglycinamide formyltransferase [Bacteroidota bacterium]OQB64283.1 MAG: Phosphoribosylglycinamide formyltransferase [Bacteroidetes bacterium ADurb.Bin141]HNT82321.1 phosphoribosylglycinamide formyltransferase [Bacteroidia bacterium]
MIRHIAIFASGSGTNAENIIAYFKDREYARVQVVLTNHAQAGVIARAHRYHVPCEIFTGEDLAQPGKILSLLQKHKTDFVVLAGFLKLMPADVVKHYEGRIINIHPALLPAFGGKGMYGERVHKAVIASGATESGITIHYVNEKFDEGKIIFQDRVPVSKDDTPETLADKIHQLEYRHYPAVIDRLLQNMPDN